MKDHFTQLQKPNFGVFILFRATKRSSDKEKIIFCFLEKNMNLKTLTLPRPFPSRAALLLSNFPPQTRGSRFDNGTSISSHPRPILSAIIEFFDVMGNHFHPSVDDDDGDAEGIRER